MDIDVEPTPAEPIVDKETKELKKIMMSKREKKLYEKIQFGKERKREAVKKLEKKKRSG
jgi:pescadillo protein